VLRERIEQAAFPVLSANVELEGEPFAESHVLLEVGDLQAVVIGLTGASAAGDVQGFKVLDSVEAARNVVAQLSPAADIVILLVHVGQVMEQRLLQEVEGVDLIVGGSRESRASTAVQDESSGALILPSEHPSPGHAGRVLGVARLTFDGQGVLQGYQSRMLALGPEVNDDPELAAMVLRYQQKRK
jgi:2',3'-cyclic-nucleotide 2'-phosphodiesterase (5'-nucleotidase family)